VGEQDSQGSASETGIVITITLCEDTVFKTIFHASAFSKFIHLGLEHHLKWFLFGQS
jgi:hypothetical protein